MAMSPSSSPETHLQLLELLRPFGRFGPRERNRGPAAAPWSRWTGQEKSRRAQVKRERGERGGGRGWGRGWSRGRSQRASVWLDEQQKAGGIEEKRRRRFFSSTGSDLSTRRTSHSSKSGAKKVSVCRCRSNVRKRGRRRKKRQDAAPLGATRVVFFLFVEPFRRQNKYLLESLSIDPQIKQQRQTESRLLLLLLLLSFSSISLPPQPPLPPIPTAQLSWTFLISEP